MQYWHGMASLTLMSMTIIINIIILLLPYINFFILTMTMIYYLIV